MKIAKANVEWIVQYMKEQNIQDHGSINVFRVLRYEFTIEPLFQSSYPDLLRNFLGMTSKVL